MFVRWREDKRPAECVRERGAALLEPEAPQVKVASAYHWAVYLQESPDLELVKLPHHMDYWLKYDEGQKRETLNAIAEMDWFITHLAVLSNHPDVMHAVNRDFAVHAMLWDHRMFEDIGPVFVLQKRTGAAGERTFFEVFEDEDPEAYRRRHHLPPATRFVRRLVLESGEHVERITLLGWELEQLPGDGHSWMTYHWYCENPVIADYTIVPRLTAHDGRNSWQDNHAPAYGVYRTPSWKPGWIVRESWPVVAAVAPYDWQSPYRPIGGEYRRGELVPVDLWMGLATYGADGAVTGRMLTAGADGAPIREGELAGALRTPDGTVFSKDDLVRVGRLLMPVHPTARVPDDGEPLAE